MKRTVWVFLVTLLSGGVAKQLPLADGRAVRF
jgi:hypothetical protein